MSLICELAYFWIPHARERVRKQHEPARSQACSYSFATNECTASRLEYHQQMEMTLSILSLPEKKNHQHGHIARQLMT